jgi:hypothetical protein
MCSFGRYLNAPPFYSDTENTQGYSNAISGVFGSSDLGTKLWFLFSYQKDLLVEA